MEDQAKREKRLAQLRENSKRYYEAHKEEIAEKARERRRAKLAAMTPEERTEYNRTNAEYQRAYRAKNPAKVAIWSARTWQRKVESILNGQEDATA